MTLRKRWFPCALGVALLGVMYPAGSQAAGCGQIAPDATDAVAAAPVHHKVVLENDAVRVLEVTVPLYSNEPPHTHFWPSVFFEQTSAPEEPWKAVNIKWSESGPVKGYVRSERYRHNLLIELKNVDCQPAPAVSLPATDAVSIHDPNISVVLENAYVRVLSVRVPPHEKDPWHTHTWPAVVVHFRKPPSQRLTPDGKKVPQPEMKELQVSFDPSSQPLHSIENVGTVMNQAYRIELKPTLKVAVAKAGAAKAGAAKAAR